MILWLAGCAILAWLAGGVSSNARQLTDVYIRCRDTEESAVYREVFESCLAAKVSLLGVAFIDWPQVDFQGIRAVFVDPSQNWIDVIVDVITSDTALAILVFLAPLSLVR